MELPINDQYRIKTDPYNYMLQKSRKRKKDGNEVYEWESFKYYGSLEAAINGLGEYMLRTSEVQSLTEALEEVKRINTTLSQALTIKEKAPAATEA